MTRQQLQQVAITYATRRSLWLIAGFCLLGFGPMMVMGMIGNESVRGRTPTAIFAIGFAAVISGHVLVTQAKWQFCDQRARLLPGFAWPHLAVMLAIAALSFGLWPCLLAAADRCNPLGVSACAISLAASYIWGVHTGRWWLGLLAVLQIFSLMTPQGTAFWVTTDNAGQFALIHAAILIAGWAALLAWLWRLTLLFEESPDYNIPLQAQSGSATRMERTQAARAIAGRLARNPSQRFLSDWWHDRLADIRASGAPRRQWLLRYGFGPTPIWMGAIFMSISCFAMFYFISRMSFTRSSPGVNISSLSMMVIMPAMMQSGVLAMRRGRMAQELLLPLSRRDYIDGILTATAINSLTMWIVMHSSLLALVAIVAPQMMTTPTIAVLTALSLAAQIYLFGVMSWIARKPSGGFRTVASMVGMIPAFIAVSIGMIAIQTKSPPEPLHPLVLKSVEHTTSPEQRAMALRHIQRHAEQVRKSQQTRPALAWTAAGTLLTIGVISFPICRRKWLETELA